MGIGKLVPLWIIFTNKEHVQATLLRFATSNYEVTLPDIF